LTSTVQPLKHQFDDVEPKCAGTVLIAGHAVVIEITIQDTTYMLDVFFEPHRPVGFQPFTYLLQLRSDPFGGRLELTAESAFLIQTAVEGETEKIKRIRLPAFRPSHKKICLRISGRKSSESYYSRLFTRQCKSVFGKSLFQQSIEPLGVIFVLERCYEIIGAMPNSA